LSDAVLYGMARATGQSLVVMDADLQHPPEQVPKLLEPLELDRADFVLGSRYVAGGATDRRWSLLQRANSCAQPCWPGLSREARAIRCQGCLQSGDRRSSLRLNAGYRSNQKRPEFLRNAA
jgi:glycosyltransferase involved in cell wall biosynthesis